MKNIIAALSLVASFSAAANPICNQVSDVVLRAAIDRDNGFPQEKVRQAVMLAVDSSMWVAYSTLINTVYSNPSIQPADFAMSAMVWCENRTKNIPGKRT